MGWAQVADITGVLVVKGKIKHFIKQNKKLPIEQNSQTGGDMEINSGEVTQRFSKKVEKDDWLYRARANGKMD